ncbi:MAG TPA: RDD family protein [Bacteroidia bacterium]|nr:RDD family protein [Bacteroidia bacterium]
MSDTASILTTQNVAINYNIASAGERTLARLLDLVIMAVYLVAMFLISNQVFSGGDWEMRETFQLPVSILITVPVLTYTLWCEPVFRGRTFGKIILGLKVVKTDGTPAGVGAAAFRWMTRLLEGELALFTFLALPVAIISGKGQRIGDMVAGTIVINTKTKVSLRSTIISHINPDYRVVFPQVSVLSDRDMNIIRDVMQQAYDTGNYHLLEYLGHKVKTVMGVFPPPQQLPTAQFLNIVLADYAHYNFQGKA